MIDNLSAGQLDNLSAGQLDNLSAGQLDNLWHRTDHDRFSLTVGTVLDNRILLSSCHWPDRAVLEHTRCLDSTNQEGSITVAEIGRR